MKLSKRKSDSKTQKKWAFITEPSVIFVLAVLLILLLGNIYHVLTSEHHKGQHHHMQVQASKKALAVLSVPAAILILAG